MGSTAKRHPESPQPGFWEERFWAPWAFTATPAADSGSLGSAWFPTHFFLRCFSGWRIFFF